MVSRNLPKCVVNHGKILTLPEESGAACSGYLGVWEQFSDDIQPFTAYAPFMTIDGNHERDYPQSSKLNARTLSELMLSMP